MADTSSGLRVLSPDIEDENEEDGEKSKDLEDLMERLRQKRKRQKSWNDAVKILKLSVSDKRSQVLEKHVLQRHLEALQKAFKVTNLSLLLERLEGVCRGVGLKFTPAPEGGSYYINSDMFYVELSVDATGVCKEAKIAHVNTEPTPCTEMVNIINSGRFDEFQEHLEGLSQMFHNIHVGDKKLFHKAHLALQSLETDLSTLSKLQSSISSVPSYIHKSPLGIVVPRVGGKPMKLIYFVGPYDLLIEKTQSTCPMTVEAIVENKVGYGVTVEMEQSSYHKLQTLPLMSVSKATDGKGMPMFSAISGINSCSLPAVFTLKLHKPMPLALSVIHEIHSTTGVEFVKESDVSPLMSLIMKQVTEEAAAAADIDTPRKGLQKLPGQRHAFFLSGGSTVGGNGLGAHGNSNNSSSSSSGTTANGWITDGAGETLRGAVVSSIPFVHPTHVPNVIRFLRQQALFNTLVGSCVRLATQNDVEEAALTFELTADSLQHITVSFEHPLKDAIATAELDLSDITGVKCRLGASAEGDSICSDEYATKVLQRCLSIPVCMRAVLKSTEAELRKQLPQATSQATAQATPRPTPPKYNHYLPPPAMTPHSSIPQHVPPPRFLPHSPVTGPPPPPPKVPPGGLPQPPGPPPPPYPPAINFPPAPGDLLPPQYAVDPDHVPQDVLDAIKNDKISKNPMLASLLDQSGSPNGSPLSGPPPPPPPPVSSSQQQQNAGPSSMLSALLGDPNGGPPTVAVAPAAPNSLVNKSHLLIDPNVQHPTGGEPPKPSCHPVTAAAANRQQPNRMTISTQARSPVGGVSPKQKQGAVVECTPLTAGAQTTIVTTTMSVSSQQQQQHHQVYTMSSSSVAGPSSSSSCASSASASPLSSGEHTLDNTVYNKERTSNCITPSSSLLSTAGNASLPAALPSVLTPVQPSTPSLMSASSSVGSHDPFDFPEPSLGDELEPAMDLDTCDLQAFTKHKSTSSKNNTVFSSKKERRREKKDAAAKAAAAAAAVYEIDKPLITVKLNTRELTARTIIKASPHHRSDSPMELSEPKKAAGGGKDLKLLKASTANIEQESSSGVVDLTDDSEVSSITQEKCSPAPRLQSSSSSNKRSSSACSESDKSSSRSEKRRKSSKHGGEAGESKAEKKRKRLEESKRQETLYKKQKIYDFDAEMDDDSFGDHIPPRKTTKIKIAGGKVQIQTSSKTIPVSSLAVSGTTAAIISAKSGKSSPSSHHHHHHHHHQQQQQQSTPPLKVLKPSAHDRASPKQSRAPKTYARSKSEQNLSSNQAGSNSHSSSNSSNSASYKDSKLNKTPTIKLKPISLPNSSSTVTVTAPNSGKSLLTPMSAPVRPTPITPVSNQMQPPLLMKRPDTPPVRLPDMPSARKPDLSPVRKSESSSSPARKQDASPTSANKKLDLVVAGIKKEASNLKAAKLESAASMKRLEVVMPVLQTSANAVIVKQEPVSLSSSSSSILLSSVKKGDSSPSVNAKRGEAFPVSSKVKPESATVIGLSKKPEPLQLTSSSGNKRPDALQFTSKKPEALQLTSTGKQRPDTPQQATKKLIPNSANKQRQDTAASAKKSSASSVESAAQGNSVSKGKIESGQLNSLTSVNRKTDNVLNNVVKKQDVASSGNSNNASKKPDNNSTVSNSTGKKVDTNSKKSDSAQTNHKKSENSRSNSVLKSELSSSKKENNQSNAAGSKSESGNKKSNKKQEIANSKRAAPIKNRKSSITDVIDKIKKGLTHTKDESGSGAGRQKEFYDAIRLEIVKAGNKTSGGTKDFPSFNKKANKKLDQSKTSDAKIETPKTPTSVENNKIPSSKVITSVTTATSTSPRQQFPPNHIKVPLVSSSVTSSQSPPPSKMSIAVGKSSGTNSVSSNSSTPSSTPPPQPSKVDINTKSPAETTPITNSAKIIPLTNDSSKVAETNNSTYKTDSVDTSQSKTVSANCDKFTPDSPTPASNPEAVVPKPKEEKSRKSKIDDISERLQSRHFLDIVTKFTPENEKGAATASNQKTAPGANKPSNGPANQRTSGDARGSQESKVNQSDNGPSRQLSNHVVENIESPPSLAKTVAPTPASPSSSISSDKLSRPQTPSDSTSNEVLCKMIPLERIAPLVGSATPTPKSPTSEETAASPPPMEKVSPSPVAIIPITEAPKQTLADNKENLHQKDNANFKTPKSPVKKLDSNSIVAKPVLSPLSDPGSPEDGLVIDCFPGSPSPTVSRSSPVVTAPTPPSRPPSVTLDRPAASPHNGPSSHPLSTSSQPQSHRTKPSPRSTPPNAKVNVGSPPAIIEPQSSPVEIDDDLMNEALML